MCGIVGLIYRDPRRPADERLVRSMCASIRHRGPDDEGVYVERAACLGARRLSIIDPAGGHQPMVTENASHAIAFNGEIYNHRHVRRDLIARGHEFRTACDTETVLRACADFGTAAVEELRGMFAFAVWDQRRQELLLARDRFGIKPLYYIDAPWGIAFSSELRALVRAGLTERRIGAEAIDTYLELGYLPAPATPFDDVRKVPPGHYLQWHRDGTTLVRYWDLPKPSAFAIAEPRRVRDAIDESVSAHTMSDVPYAVFLSGGLDSSSVAASLAARGHAPHAFVARYLGTGAALADETALAQALAGRWNIPLSVVDVDPDVTGTFDAIVQALDEPIADDSVVPSWTLAQAVGREFKVALTGIGGDELFAGYRRHLGMVATEAYRLVPAPFRRRLADAARTIDETSHSASISRAKRFLDGGAGGAGDRFLSLVSRLRDEDRLALHADSGHLPAGGSAARRIFRTIAREAGLTSPLATALYLEYKTFLADDILALADRISMAHSLELRVPFVDHKLVEGIHPLPACEKVGWGQSKKLLRSTMRDRLTPAHFGAPKRGFVGPTALWLRDDLRPLLRDELSAARMKRLGFFDGAVVDRLCAEHDARRQNRESILWALLTFSVWHRTTLESAAPFAEPIPPRINAFAGTISPSRARTEAGRTNEKPPLGHATAAN